MYSAFRGAGLIPLQPDVVLSQLDVHLRLLCLFRQRQCALLRLCAPAELGQSIQQFMGELANALVAVARNDSSILAICDKPRLWNVLGRKVS
jgi:hypothetical protein